MYVQAILLSINYTVCGPHCNWNTDWPSESYFKNTSPQYYCTSHDENSMSPLPRLTEFISINQCHPKGPSWGPSPLWWLTSGTDKPLSSFDRLARGLRWSLLSLGRGSLTGQPGTPCPTSKGGILSPRANPVRQRCDQWNRCEGDHQGPLDLQTLRSFIVRLPSEEGVCCG